MFGSLVWSKLLHVMLVYQCAGFWFLEVLPNIVKHVLTMFNWFGGLVFGIWFVSVWDHLVHVMLVCQLLVLISQVLSKHRRTCFHNAQLVWNCHVFKSREIRYAWIVGLEQTVYIVLLVWFLKVFLNIVKHVCTMFNWFRNLVFSSHVEFVMFGSLVWSKLFHVMLVCLSPGFGF